MAVSAGDIGAQLAHQDPAVKVAGLTALRELEQPEGHLAAAAALVGDPHWTVRQAAADVFGAFGARGAAQAQALGGLLAAADPGVVAAAATALCGIGVEAASQAPALEAALGRGGEDKSTLALAVAGAVPKAPAALRKPPCAAAAALAAVGAAGAKSAPKVAALLKDPDGEIRGAAVGALGAMGREGAKFESQAMELLGDPGPFVVAAACAALGQMALSTTPSESVASAVAEHLASPYPAVRAAAAKSLGDMGEEAEGHLEGLVRLLSGVAPAAKVGALAALGKCGELGQMYAADICRCTWDYHPAVRLAACEALAAMGERGAGFREDVEQLLMDDFEEVREAAQQALERFAAGPAKRLTAQAEAVDEAGSPSVAAAALLFPGQGSQYLRMMEGVKDLPAVRDMLERAQAILGYDILAVCLEGPEDKLEQTKFCQPAMYVGGLAAVEQLRLERPDVLGRVQAVAGLSLGEYAALTFAGVLDFDTGLRLVKLRAEAMQDAAEASEQLMCSVAGLEEETLGQLCKESAGPGETCQIANNLFPRGFSCAGSRAAIERLMEAAQKAPGCLQAKQLKTSGAFHTPLMQPAKERLLQGLRDAEAKMKPPTCDLYMNVSGKKVGPGTAPGELIPLLGEQLCSCVLWRPSVEAMINDGISEFYECGPMKQLKAMMKRINEKASQNMTNIQV